MNEYSRDCADCPNVGPPARTRHEATLKAFNDGWHVRRNSDESRDMLCPDCWREWLASKKGA